MNNDVSKKKKTSKEKRILIASLCIAAAVMAGSTFAWFSSKDEVTNRLTANADYGVSIVESFSPPENWMPGSVVNKDVYATNTGNIGAFVNEDVSGVLTVTKERKVTTFSSDCVELTEEERYAIEAGSFLAFKPDGDTRNQLGNQIVIRPSDQGDPATTDFTPFDDGLYVFRRSIDVANDRSEEFEYEGYYYDAATQKYYKISDLEVTPDADADLANDGVNTDGILSAATCGFYKEEQEVVKPVSLEYDAEKHRLVASYDTGVDTATQEEKLAAAQAYDEAIHRYELANEAYLKAASEASDANEEVAGKYAAYSAAQSALNTANNRLAAAVADRTAKQNAYDALVAEKADLEAEKEALEIAMFGKAGGSTVDYEAGSLYADSIKDIGTAADNQRLKDEVTAWLATNPAGVTNTTFEALTYDELKLFSPTQETHTYYNDLVAKTKAQEDYNTYNNRLTAVNARLTAIGDDETAATEMKAAYDALQTANTEYTNANADAATKQSERDDAYNAWQTALNGIGAANDANLVAAQNKLNEATAEKAAAKKAYEKAIASPTESLLKININLSNEVTTGGNAGKWQLLPSTIDDDTAHFYYTSILAPGETSSKLIDSVELDDSATQDMYKSFDFDVNVALKSAQVVYGEDQTTILPTAATKEIGKTPTLANNQDINTVLTWS